MFQKSKTLGNIPEDLRKKKLFQKAGYREPRDLPSSNLYLGTGVKASKHLNVMYMGKELKKKKKNFLRLFFSLNSLQRKK